MLAIECEDVGQKPVAQVRPIGAGGAGLRYGRQHLPHAFQRGFVPGARRFAGQNHGLHGSRNRHFVVLPGDESRHRDEGNGGNSKQRHQPCSD